MRAGNALMAVMGGPLGIVMTAAAALSYFALSANDSKQASSDLANAVDNALGRFSAVKVRDMELLISQQRKELNRLTTEYVSLSEAQVGGQSLYQRVFESTSELKARAEKEELERAGQLKAAGAEKEKALDRLLALEEKLNKIKEEAVKENTQLNSNNNPKDVKTLDSANKLLATLQKQIALYGRKGELAKINYELEHGKLSGIDEQLKSQLRSEAALLDAKQRQGELAQAGKQTLSSLTRQVALYGKKSELLKLNYEIEYGSLKGINGELAKQLQYQAQLLDGKKQQETAKEFNNYTGTIASRLKRKKALGPFVKDTSDNKEHRAIINENFDFDQRNDALKAQFDKAREEVTGNHEVMMNIDRDYFAAKEALRAEHESNLSEISRKAEDERSNYQRDIAMGTLTFTQQQLSITTNFLKQSGKEQSGLYRLLLAAQKLAAIPSMIISTEVGATKALELGPIAGPIASTAIKALGYASVGIVAGQAISGQAHDGINRVPAHNEGTWMLKANEMVLNPVQADNFRWMTDYMREMKTFAQQKSLSYQTQHHNYIPPSVNVKPTPVNVVFVDDKKQLDNYLASDIGEDAVMKIVRRNKVA